VCYLIVLFLWAEIYHTANKQDLKDPSLKIRNLKGVFLTVVALIWAAVIILYSLDFAMFESTHMQISMHTNVVEMTVIVLISLLYIVSAFAFLIYGVRFYLELHRAGNSMFTVQSRRQVIAVLCVCVFVFELHGDVLLHSELFWKCNSVRARSGCWRTRID
jgi:formate hydrogenlyase subunit 3/multisubunit Na+/H+ antiporter MnhD subunit